MKIKLNFRVCLESQVRPSLSLTLTRVGLLGQQGGGLRKFDVQWKIVAYYYAVTYLLIKGKGSISFSLFQLPTINTIPSSACCLTLSFTGVQFSTTCSSCKGFFSCNVCDSCSASACSLRPELLVSTMKGFPYCCNLERISVAPGRTCLDMVRVPSMSNTQPILGICSGFIQLLQSPHRTSKQALLFFLQYIHIGLLV